MQLNFFPWVFAIVGRPFDKHSMKVQKLILFDPCDRNNVYRGRQHFGCVRTPHWGGYREFLGAWKSQNGVTTRASDEAKTKNDGVGWRCLLLIIRRMLWEEIRTRAACLSLSVTPRQPFQTRKYFVNVTEIQFRSRKKSNYFVARTKTSSDKRQQQAHSQCWMRRPVFPTSNMSIGTRFKIW